VRSNRTVVATLAVLFGNDTLKLDIRRLRYLDFKFGCLFGMRAVNKVLAKDIRDISSVVANPTLNERAPS